MTNSIQHVHSAITARNEKAGRDLYALIIAAQETMTDDEIACVICPVFERNKRNHLNLIMKQMKQALG